MMRALLLAALLCFIVAPTFAYISAADEALIEEIITEFNIRETIDLTDIEASSAAYKSFQFLFNMRKSAQRARANEASNFYKCSSNYTSTGGMCSWAATDGKSCCASYDTSPIKAQLEATLLWSGGLPNTCQRRVMEISCAQCAVDANDYTTDYPTPLPQFPVRLCGSYCRTFYSECSTQMTINGTKYINASSADELCAGLNETNCYDGTTLNFDGSYCPYSSTLARQKPLALSQPDDTCGFKSICCSADAVALAASSISLVVDTSKYPKCYNALIDAACAECDPNSGYWTNPVSETPLVCKSMCDRRVKACTGATSSSGQKIDVPTSCTIYPDSSDPKQCYVGSPKNTATPLAISLAAVVVSAIVALL